MPPWAQMKPAQHWELVLQLGGLVQGTQRPSLMSHLKPEQQSEEPEQVSGLVQQAPAAQTCPATQHWLPQAVVPAGHSQAQVVGLKVWPGEQVTQMPVEGQVKVPGAQAQRAVEGSQKWLQHSSFWRQTVPALRQRPGAAAVAPPAPTRLRTPPTVVAPKSFIACRLDVEVDTALDSSS